MARGLLKKLQLKPGLLTTPKDHWPPFERGIHMEVAEKPSADGRPMFRYTHSAAYHVRLCIPPALHPLHNITLAVY